MTNVKLSQIPASPANAGASDSFVGVGTGPTDYRYSLSQISNGFFLTGQIKKILRVNIDYYISATGSDSNGGTNPTTDAWATLQHAMIYFAQNIDLGGNVINVHIGTGTFAGLGITWTSGGGYIQWVGSGSANTIIDNGPNDGTLNTGECVSFFFGLNTVHAFFYMTFKPSVDTFAVIDSFAGMVCDFYDNTTEFVPPWDVVIDCTGLTSAGDVVFWVDNPAAQFIDKGITYVGGGATIANIFLVEAGGEYIVGTNGTSSSVTGSLTFSGAASALAWADLAGSISVIANPAFSGSAGVVGKRFHVGFGGNIGVEGQPAGTVGPNTFPGTVAGTCDPGGTYDGYSGAIQASGLPTTTQFPNTGTGGLYKDTSGGGVYIVYNDAGTIKKVALT